MTLSKGQVRATVGVSDVRKAADFYEGTLGLSPQDEQGMEAVRIYPCEGGSLLQVYASEHAGSGTATAASWSVADFDSVVEELRERGVAFESYDDPEVDEQGVHSYGEHKVVWFTDPHGNTLAVDNGRAPTS